MKNNSLLLVTLASFFLTSCIKYTSNKERKLDEIFPKGSVAPAENFTGNAWTKSLLPMDTFFEGASPPEAIPRLDPSSNPFRDTDPDLLSFGASTRTREPSPSPTPTSTGAAAAVAKGCGCWLACRCPFKLVASPFTRVTCCAVMPTAWSSYRRPCKSRC